jgi:hypothetical protein
LPARRQVSRLRPPRPLIVGTQCPRPALDDRSAVLQASSRRRNNHDRAAIITVHGGWLSRAFRLWTRSQVVVRAYETLAHAAIMDKVTIAAMQIAKLVGKLPTARMSCWHASRSSAGASRIRYDTRASRESWSRHEDIDENLQRKSPFGPCLNIYHRYVRPVNIYPSVDCGLIPSTLDASAEGWHPAQRLSQMDTRASAAVSAAPAARRRRPAQT